MSSKLHILQVILASVIVCGVTFCGILLVQQMGGNVTSQSTQRAVQVAESIEQLYARGIVSEDVGEGEEIYLVDGMQEWYWEDQNMQVKTEQEFTVVSDYKLQEYSKQHTTEAELAMLEAFEDYYNTKNFYSIDKTMATGIQIFQDNKGIWNMLLSGVDNGTNEWDVLLVKYIDGSVEEEWIGYWGSVQLSRDFQSLYIKHGGIGELSYILYDLSDIQPMISLIGIAERPGYSDVLDTDLWYGIQKNISPMEIWDLSTEVQGEQLYGQQFLDSFNEACLEVGIDIYDASMQEQDWCGDVVEAYQNWMMDSYEAEE